MKLDLLGNVTHQSSPFYFVVGFYHLCNYLRLQNALLKYIQRLQESAFHSVVSFRVCL